MRFLPAAAVFTVILVCLAGCSLIPTEDLGQIETLWLTLLEDEADGVFSVHAREPKEQDELVVSLQRALLGEVSVLGVDALDDEDHRDLAWIDVRLLVPTLTDEDMAEFREWALQTGFAAFMVGASRDDFAELTANYMAETLPGVGSTEASSRMQVEMADGSWTVSGITLPEELRSTLEDLEKALDSVLDQASYVAGTGFSDGDGTVAEAKVGDVLWSMNLGEGLPGAPHLVHVEDAGLVFRTQAEIGVIDPETGDRLWSRSDPVRAGLHAWTFHRDVLVYSFIQPGGAAGEDTVHLRAVRVSDGTTVWQAQAAGEHVVSSLRGFRFVDGVILLVGVFRRDAESPGLSHAVHCQHTGWHLGTYEGLPQVAGRFLYEVSVPGSQPPFTVSKHHLYSGVTQWSETSWDDEGMQVDVMDFVLVGVDAEVVVFSVTCLDYELGWIHRVHAISAVDGFELWSIPGRGRRLPDGMVFVGDEDTGYVLDAVTGEVVLEVELPGARDVLMTERGFVFTGSGVVVGMSCAGDELFRVEVKTPSLHLSDDRLFISGVDSLAAVDIGSMEIAWERDFDADHVSRVYSIPDESPVIMVEIMPLPPAVQTPPVLRLALRTCYRTYVIMDSGTGEELERYEAVMPVPYRRIEDAPVQFLYGPDTVFAVCLATGTQMWAADIGAGALIERPTQELIEGARSLTRGPAVQSREAAAFEYAPYRIEGSRLHIEPLRALVLDRATGEPMYVADIGQYMHMVGDKLLRARINAEGEVILSMVGPE